MTLREINLKIALAKHYETRVRNRFPIDSEFGRLTVVGYEKLKSGWAVLCKCKCGGKKTVLYPNQMKRGLVSSCGCVWKEARRKNIQGKRVKLPEGEACLNALYRGYARNARARGLVFLIAPEQFREIVSKACAYCGEPPAALPTAKHYNGPFIGNGVDRADSSQGYTAENCVPCCKRCNYAKREMTTEEFLAWARRVVQHTS